MKNIIKILLSSAVVSLLVSCGDGGATTTKTPLDSVNGADGLYLSDEKLADSSIKAAMGSMMLDLQLKKDKSYTMNMDFKGGASNFNKPQIPNIPSIPNLKPSQKPNFPQMPPKIQSSGTYEISGVNSIILISDKSSSTPMNVDFDDKNKNGILDQNDTLKVKYGTMTIKENKFLGTYSLKKIDFVDREIVTDHNKFHFKFHNDGSLNFMPMNMNGKWTLENDKIKLDFKILKMDLTLSANKDNRFGIGSVIKSNMFPKIDANVTKVIPLAK